MAFALGGFAACAAFVALNHFLLAMMLHLARGHSIRETGLFSMESLSVELVLTSLGVALATFWTSNPWLIPLALSPLLVVHRSLTVPQLQAEARVDPKTGLFNARHFGQALEKEIGRAVRFNRPLALSMADLDLLRDINNSYRHLAGDAVLKGIAEVFRQQLRHYDIPARFGGEEFSILLPETSPEQALEIAERIRRAVAEHSFEVETSSDPIRATVSISIAGFPKDATDANELIHQADLAVYRAKLQGRNRVLGASAEPLLLPAERSARLVAVPEDGEHHEPLPGVPETKPAVERRHHPRPHALHGPRFLSLSGRLSALVGLVSIIAAGAAALGFVYGQSTDWIGLLAIVLLVGVSQALALEVVDQGPLSVAAVGALAGAAPRRSPWPSRPWPSSGARAATRCTRTSSTSARSRSRRSRPPGPSPARTRSSCSPRRASWPGRSTSRPTWACWRSPWPWRATSAGGASSASASPGCCRTTSSTASSAA